VQQDVNHSVLEWMHHDAGLIILDYVAIFGMQRNEFVLTARGAAVARDINGVSWHRNSITYQFEFENIPMGGRPRKPTAVLELAGAFNRNPNRARDDEPVPQGKPGDAPEYLGDGARRIWDDMVQAGFWLTDADRFLLEVAAAYLDMFRAGIAEPKHTAQLINVLNKLGFGPAERSKIKAPGAKPEAADPFADFK
jgi:hypothetical protein